MGSREHAQGQPRCGDTQGEESRRTCAKRQVRDSADQAPVSDRSADHKSMPQTLEFTKLEDWSKMGSTSCSRETLLHERTGQTLGNDGRCEVSLITTKET